LASTREQQEVWEAYERLVAECIYEEYMAELHRQYLEGVDER
jgi:hypothetical protein